MSTCQRSHFAGLFAILSAVFAVGCSGSENEYQAPPPPPVTVAAPVIRDVPIYIEENGETEAVERAEVMARVTGFLLSLEFAPGDEVGFDDPLYYIEPDRYQLTRDAAEAAQSAAEASVHVAEGQIGTLAAEQNRAQLEFDRQKQLLADDATTQQQYDNAEAALQIAIAQSEAAVANKEAAEADRDQAAEEVNQADLDLGYTTVKAPIAGNITTTEVKVGNLVNEGTHLATIVNRDTIYANFSVSDRDILRMQRAAIEERGGRPAEEPDYSQFEVHLQREIDDGFPFVGHLDYIDQEGVDQATGTFSLRAVFENPDDLIFPGLFVRVRLPIGVMEDAVLIPELAVSRDPQGMYVQVLEEGKLARRNVVTGPVVNTISRGEANSDSGGDDAEANETIRMVVVQEGLSTEDRVVIEGGFGIRPGMDVDATETSLAGVELVDTVADDDGGSSSDDSATSE